MGRPGKRDPQAGERLAGPEPSLGAERADQVHGALGTAGRILQRRVAERRGPDDRSGSAGREHGSDRILVAQAARHFAGDSLSCRGHDPLDSVRLAACPVTGSVQINHMDPPRACRRKAPRNLRWVVAVDRLPPEVALG